MVREALIEFRSIMTRADLLTGSSGGGPEAVGVEETVAAPPELDTVLPELGPGASGSHPKQFPILEILRQSVMGRYSHELMATFT